MSRLEPIPTPTAQRWREFRIQVVPVLVFLGAVCAAIYIWNTNISAPTFQGEAESTRTQVVSPQDGRILELKVSRFENVTKGDIIAVLQPSDPRASLAIIQSELDVLRLGTEPAVTQQRNATDYERLRLEWLLQKVELAETRHNLALAENELKRNETLFKDKIISESLYDLSLKIKEGLEARVAEQNRVIADVEKTLQRLNQLNDLQSTAPASNAFLDRLQALEEKVASAETRFASIPLTAPIDGMVTMVFKQPGENVLGGEPIVMISGAESERIVGYLRQPFPIEPEVGMPVEVTTRSSRRLTGLARISQVGAQLEPITNSVAMVRPGMLVDMGLPIEITLPREFKVRPGELVDLIVRP